MAFPIPSHLPRRANPQDISSKILSKIDEATNRSLTASLAKSWLAELDETIQSTKVYIHVPFFTLSTVVVIFMLKRFVVSRNVYMNVYTPTCRNSNSS
jgi:hypothetical protein